ncbi:nuclease PIN [Klebsiella aerogenes]|nr:nuclease PIN [Klebsiella aerogenes]ELY3087346.1 nuclease PIN [Klebsiella aerogenes]
MKNFLAKTGVLSLIFISFASNAKVYCNLLWANNNLPGASLNVTLDGKDSGVFPLALQAGGDSTVIDQYEEDMKYGPVTVSGMYRHWLQYPEGWKTTPEGLKYRIRTNLENATIQTPGLKTVVTPQGSYTWQNTYGCIPLGGHYSFNTTSISGVQIEIDRGTAWPGRYSISLPLKVAYEENKGMYNGEHGGGWPVYAAAIRRFNVVDSKNVQITITSKCDIAAKELSVNLGDSITPAEARSGVLKNVDVMLQCNSPANISLSLKGLQPVDAEVNKTRCGSGSCRLFFDNNHGDKTMSVGRGGTALPISVLFQANNAEVGAFSGNAVLTMNIL